MIRMNKRMQARAQEQTDAALARLDPAGDQGLLVLVDTARRANGSVPYREEDLLALLERARRTGGVLGEPTPVRIDGLVVGDSVTLDELTDIFEELATGMAGATQ
jgi:hypothetical protein